MGENLPETKPFKVGVECSDIILTTTKDKVEMKN